MALHWNWSDKVGSMVVTRQENKYKVDIYVGNALAIFVHEYKSDDGKDMYELYSFFADMGHASRMVKHYGSLFGEQVSNIRLNLYGAGTRPILNLLTKNGYEVKCYYKEPKKSKKIK